jgi:hypothetical protein
MVSQRKTGFYADERRMVGMEILQIEGVIGTSVSRESLPWDISLIPGHL